MNIIQNLRKLVLIVLTFSLVIQASSQDNTITVASWNMKNFGKTKLNDADRVSVIADVIRKYDVIAMQEIKDKSGALPSILVSLVNGDSLNYRFIESLRVGVNVQESYVIMFNSDKVEYVPGTMGHIRDYEDKYEREPFFLRCRH